MGQQQQRELALSLATEMLELYIQAEKDVLAGKSITMRGESMDLEDLDKIRAGREEWERKASAENRKGRRYSIASWS